MWSPRPMDKTARVWDLREKQPSFVALEGHQDPVNSAAFSPDGTHVVTASWDKTARVWDLREKQPSFVALEGHQGPVDSAAFSPDGTHVVTASDDKTARVWDLRAKPPSFVALEGHQGPVYVGGVQPGRNPCRHRVRRQDGAGVARLSRCERADRRGPAAPFPLPQPGAARRLRTADRASGFRPQFHPAADG